MSCVCINNNNNIVHVFIPFVYSLVSCILLEIVFNTIKIKKLLLRDIVCDRVLYAVSML